MVYALEHKGIEIIILGKGNPYSVTKNVEGFNMSIGVKIKDLYGGRRPVDLPKSYANADKA